MALVFPISKSLNLGIWYWLQRAKWLRF